MSRFFVLLLAAGALLVVSMPTADAGYYYRRAPTPTYRYVRPLPPTQPYPQGRPYYYRRGNLGGVPGQTAGPTCVYIINGRCYFY